MKTKGKRDYILEQILENNYNLHMAVRKQVKLLEEYEKDCIGEVHKENYIKGYEEMLDLIGITINTFDDEWDSEAGRKS